MTLFKVTIPGRAYVKKNGAKVFRAGASRRMVYTPNFIQWKNRAETYVALAKRDQKILQPIDGELNMRAIFYFENKSCEADLCALYEGIQDVLQSMMVITNDKIIHGHDGSRKVFYQEPRLEIELTYLNATNKGELNNDNTRTRI